MKTILEVYHGDITTLNVDVIVNAANETLLGGGGVDGAIHAAAGPELLEECKKLNGCHRGQAKLTKGYNLQAKHVIHTIGPKYGQEDGLEDEILANCYINSLNIAKDKRAKTVAFPNISTGVYRYPKDEAAEIAINTVKDFIKKNPTAFDKIIFVSYTEADYKLFKEIFDDMTEE